MRKIALVGLALLVVAGVAQAQTCLDFSGFCDAIQVDSVNNGRIDGSWRNIDCAGGFVNVEGAIRAGVVGNPCGANGNAVIDCSSAGAEACNVGGGDWYFVLDSLDGSMDMNNGVPFGGSCWIPGLLYDVSMGACPVGPQQGLRPLEPLTGN